MKGLKFRRKIPTWWGRTTLECPVCKKEFSRPNHYIRYAASKGYRIHCSNPCRYENLRVIKPERQKALKEPSHNDLLADLYYILLMSDIWLEGCNYD